MSLDLFRRFPAVQRLLVQFVTDKRRGGAELTASNPELAPETSYGSRAQPMHPAVAERVIRIRDPTFRWKPGIAGA